MSDEVDHYTEIARRLMNELIESVVAYSQTGGISVKDLEKERKRHEKELTKWQDAAQQLKTNLKLMAEDNDRLEHEIAMVEKERDDLRRQVNEMLMGRQAAARKLGEYPIGELMSPEARTKWDELRRMMTEVPYRGEKDNGS